MVYKAIVLGHIGLENKRVVDQRQCPQAHPTNLIMWLEEELTEKILGGKTIGVGIKKLDRSSIMGTFRFLKNKAVKQSNAANKSLV